MSEKRRRSQLIYNSSRSSRDVNYDNVPHKHVARAFACQKFAEVSNGTTKRNWFVWYTYSIEECYPTSCIVAQRSTTIHPFLGPPPLFANVEEFFVTWQSRTWLTYARLHVGRSQGHQCYWRDWLHLRQQHLCYLSLAVIVECYHTPPYSKC